MINTKQRYIKCNTPIHHALLIMFYSIDYEKLIIAQLSEYKWFDFPGPIYV